MEAPHTDGATEASTSESAPTAMEVDASEPHASNTSDASSTDNNETENRKRKGEPTPSSALPASKRMHPALSSEQPRQVPIQVQMRHFLAPNGGLAYNADVDAFWKLMKKESLFEHQAFFINVLLKTNNRQLLDAFVHSDGLLVPRSWLVRARKDNDKLTRKLLELFRHLPMDLAVVKESQIGRVVNKIKQDHANEEIRRLAADLVTIWGNLLQQQRSAEASVAESSRTATATTAATTTEQAQTSQPVHTAQTTTAPTTVTATTPAAPRRPAIVRRVGVPTATEGSGTTGSSSTGARLPLRSALKRPRTGDASSNANGMPELAPIDVTNKTEADAMANTEAPARPVKRVRFRPDQELVQVWTFELIPGERAYTGRIPDGQGGHMPNPREWDRAEGREIFSARGLRLHPTTSWHAPMLLKLPVTLEFGRKSSERFVQMERERTTLAALYSEPDLIPVSPEEPEELVTGASPTESETILIPWEVPADIAEDDEADEDDDEEDDDDGLSDVARQVMQLLYSQLPAQTSGLVPPNPITATPPTPIFGGPFANQHIMPGLVPPPPRPSFDTNWMQIA